MIKRHIGGFSNFNSSYDWKPRCQVSFFDVFETYSRDENGFLQYSFELVDKQFICLDTKKDEPVSAGQYCEKRMRWLDSELSKTSKGVWIFMHHPPFEVGVPYMDRIKLEEAEEFRDLISGY